MAIAGLACILAWMRALVGYRAGGVLLGVLLFVGSAQAGMPSFTLTEIGRMRVETISFFVLVFLASAAGVMGLWNLLRKDFPRLPRLTYKRALCMVCLWGALFVLLLTMIAGTRELLTPGAWEKQGAVYHLKDGR